MPEPITPRSPRPVRWATLAQQWRDLTFLHWPVDPVRVAGLLPAGTRPDELDGVTFVGLVPFWMPRLGLPAARGVPDAGALCETNVRLYSVDGSGRRGVVFLSMDADRLLPVLVGRAAVRLPYTWSRMSIRRERDVLTYRCRGRRLRGADATSRAVVSVGRPVQSPTPLERFLTCRWGLHVSWFGRTVYLPNEHPEWPLRQAELLDLDDGLVAAAGVPQPDAPPVSVLSSPGVPVRFGAPITVARRSE